MNVAGRSLMDEILKRIQRTNAPEGLNGHQPAASPRPLAQGPSRRMSDEEELSGRHSKPVMPGRESDCFLQRPPVRRPQCSHTSLQYGASKGEAANSQLAASSALSKMSCASCCSR